MSYILCFSQLFFVYFVTFVVNHYVVLANIFHIPCRGRSSILKMECRSQGRAVVPGVDDGTVDIERAISQVE